LTIRKPLKTKPIATTASSKARSAKAPDPEATESKTPLYVSVQRALMERIEHKQYTVGSRLPTEGDLCKEFHVSRHTIREALRSLRNAGFISSRQGSGYTIESVAAQHLFVHSIGSLDELFQYVSTAKLHVLEIGLVEADSTMAARLNCSPGRRWLRICGVRRVLSSAKPIGVVEVFVPASYAGIRRQIPDYEGPVYELIEKTYGERIEEVVQTMRAAVIPARYAKELQMEPNAPALEIERVFKSPSGKVMEISFNFHGVDRFSYKMVLRKARSAADH